MDANIVNLQSLFGDQVSYQIPQFQRPYAWAENDQWMPLWGDVRNVAERCRLSIGTTDSARPHFLGAVVLQQRESKTGEVTKRLVVDGQQRLTTLQLLIKAAQQAFHHADDFARVERLRALTENSDSHLGNDTDNQTKIRQSNRNDQQAFQEAIRVILPEGQRDQPIIRAFKYFEGEVNAWLDNGKYDITVKSNALEKALTKRILIAVIDLDKEEKPHLIFETLNARGEQLRQSDLVKNTVMYEAEVVDDERAAERLWGMFNDNWWRQSTGETRVDRLQLDRFLNHWLVMRTRKLVAPNRVASEFRDFLENEECHSSMSIDIEKVTASTRDAGRIYQKMLEAKYPEHEFFFKRMQVMDIAAIMPMLLYLKKRVSGRILARCFQIIESFLVRRMLSNYHNRNAGNITVGLLKKLHEEQAIGRPDIIIARHLSAATHDATFWPNDRILQESLHRPIAGSVARRRIVLEAIEMYLRGNMAEPLGATDRLTLEHIMPQRWETHYKPSDGKTIEEISDERNDAVKYLGNLTLTTDKLNSRLSNAPWDEKRQTLHEHSSLFLNKTLLDDAPIDRWDEDAISDRTSKLAACVVEIWKPAEYFLSTSN